MTLTVIDVNSHRKCNLTSPSPSTHLTRTYPKVCAICPIVVWVPPPPPDDSHALLITLCWDTVTITWDEDNSPLFSLCTRISLVFWKKWSKWGGKRECKWRSAINLSSGAGCHGILLSGYRLTTGDSTTAHPTHNNVNGDSANIIITTGDLVFPSWWHCLSDALPHTPRSLQIRRYRFDYWCANNDHSAMVETSTR